MAKDAPFITGRRAVIKFVLDDEEVVLNTTKWGCKPNVTKIEDHCNGEERARLDVQINFYEFTATCKVRDVKIIRAWLKKIQNEDAAVAPLDEAIGVRIKPRDGSRTAFVGTEVSWDMFDFDAAEASSTSTVQMEWRARYFKEAKAA